MSAVQKFKDFFGLAPYEGEMDEAYYDEAPHYSAAPAYEDTRAARAYAPVRREYEANIVAVHVTEYAEATKIGEPFRDGDAVVFDMSEMSTDDARRIIDFAAGICYALRGDMKKLSPRVFAVIPEHAQVTTYELEKAGRLHTV